MADRADLDPTPRKEKDIETQQTRRNAGKVVTHKSLLNEISGSEADPERPQHIQTE